MAATIALITLFNVFHIIQSQTTGNCPTLYVTIESFGSSSVDHGNWEGVYTQTNKTSFDAPIWRIPGPDSNKWLKYIETHWVLSGQNNELLIYNSSILFPPTNKSSTWIHEYYTDTATLTLDCSDSLSPTFSPTFSPTISPVNKPVDSHILSARINHSKGTEHLKYILFPPVLTHSHHIHSNQFLPRLTAQQSVIASFWSYQTHPILTHISELGHMSDYLMITQEDQYGNMMIQLTISIHSFNFYHPKDG